MPGWLYVPLFLGAWCTLAVLLGPFVGRILRGSSRHYPAKPPEGGHR